MIAQKSDAAGRHMRQIELCLATIKRTAEKAGLDNVEVKDVSQPDTGLPENCCDVIFIRGVYHHFTQPGRDGWRILSCAPSRRKTLRVRFLAELVACDTQG